MGTDGQIKLSEKGNEWEIIQEALHAAYERQRKIEEIYHKYRNTGRTIPLEKTTELKNRGE